MKPQQKPAQQQFDSVARIIAKGEPPQWLVSGLELFSPFVGADRTTSDEHKQGQKILERMHDAADLLINWLPGFEHLSMGIQSPDVAIALDVLPRVRRQLAHAKSSPRGGGQRPNVLRKTCAAVVVEAWRLVHGEPEPYSVELWKACNEYWQACGGEYRGGDVDNWKRDAEEAVAAPHVWIKNILSALRGQYATS
jgi:hypothetical protein